jgi:hypothetical protein
LRQFGKLITALRREGADPVRKGRPWSLPLEDRVLLVAAYWRANLTLRQLAPLFGVYKSAADRIIDHLGPALALPQRKGFRKDTGYVRRLFVYAWRALRPVQSRLVWLLNAKIVVGATGAHCGSPSALRAAAPHHAGVPLGPGAARRPRSRQTACSMPTTGRTRSGSGNMRNPWVPCGTTATRAPTRTSTSTGTSARAAPGCASLATNVYDLALARFIDNGPGSGEITNNNISSHRWPNGC